MSGGYTVSEQCACNGAFYIDKNEHTRGWRGLYDNWVSRHRACTAEVGKRSALGFASETRFSNDHSLPELQTGFARPGAYG